MSYYFLCSQNKDSINNRFIQFFISDFVAAEFPKTPSPKPVRIPNFNHLDFARNSFELCPTNTAKIRNSNFRQKYSRHEVPSVLNYPQKILNLQGFATLRVARRSPIQL